MKKLLLLPFLFLLLLASSSATAQTEITPTPIYIELTNGRIRIDQIVFETEIVTPSPTPTETSTPTSTPTPTLTPTATPNNTTQMTLDLYRNPGWTLTGYYGLEWYWAGTAASSSIVHIYADYLKGHEILYAKWQVAWNPNADSIPTGIQLSYLPLLISRTPVVMGTIEMSNYHSPRTDMVIVTDSVQDILDSGIPMQVMEQTHGNGTNGALIYSSTLYILLR